MTKELRIPLKYKEGCFSFSSINESSENFLLLTFGEYNDLSYNVPVGGNEVRLYNISYTPPEEYLYATYNSEGTLKYAEMIDGDDVRLVYIGYTDDDDARAEVTDFAEQSADIISEELLKRREKAARLFIEYYRDTESFDFAAKTAAESEVRELLESLPKEKRNPRFDAMVINNSGNFPNENRISCDRDTISVMLRCAPHKIYTELMDTAIKIMSEKIQNTVVNALEKTDDFRTIAEEYD